MTSKGFLSLAFTGTKAIDAALDDYNERVHSNLRAIAQAGAEVLYQEVKLRAPISTRANKLQKSGNLTQPGALKASIYQVYSETFSTPERATYHVSWNYTKAPHGHLVEFGTSRAPAGHPFLRPSYDTKAKDALAASQARLIERMKGVAL